MKKQGFTILLILLMSMISTKAFADATGKCGYNLYWTYVEATGTLTISGSGAIDFSFIGDSPWYSYRKNIKNAIIEEGVTSIGNYAFDGVDLTTVVSLIENPFVIEGKSSSYSAFNVNTFNNATLYVPVGTIDKYKATNGWKDFAYIVEGTPTGIKVIENTQKKNATVYDLNGVRLSEPKKGINIINGQKVVVK